MRGGQQQQPGPGLPAGLASAEAGAALHAADGPGNAASSLQTGVLLQWLQQHPQPAPAAPPAPVWPPGMEPQWQPQWQQQAAAPAAAALNPPHMDPQVMAAKLAAAREKNRLAQQRFRERRRQRQQEAGQQCEVLQEEIEQLETEIAALRAQNRMYQRVLAVRDAMLQTFTSMQPPEAQAAALQQPSGATPTSAEQQGPVVPAPQLPAPETAGGLVQALNELPSEGELEAAAQSAEAADGQAKQVAAQELLADSNEGAAATGSSTSSLEGSSGAEACAAVGPAPQSLLGEAHRSGTAHSLDGSALQEVEEVPAPSNKALLARIEAWTGPEDLLVFVRQWQADLHVAYQAADASGFDGSSVAELEGLVKRMTEMWWHVGQLRPAYLSYLAHVALPENSGQLALWREIASEVMPYITDMGLALLRRSWHNYSKRLAKVAVGVSKWVHKLQTYTVQQPEGLVVNAQRALELAEISSHIAAAVQEEYVASMELVARQFPVSNMVLQAYTNYRCSPYLPDIVAIVYNIVCIDSEHRAAEAMGVHRPRLLATRPAPSSRIPDDPPGKEVGAAPQH